MKTMLVQLLLLIAFLVCWFKFVVEYVPATETECQSAETIAQAVVERDLSWIQILICPEQHAPQELGFSLAFRRRE